MLTCKLYAFLVSRKVGISYGPCLLCCLFPHSPDCMISYLLIFPKSMILLIITGCSEVYERIADMYDQTSKFWLAIQILTVLHEFIINE